MIGKEPFRTMSHPVAGLVTLVLMALTGITGAQEFKIENPDVGYSTQTRFGSNVSVDGDTMIGGAPYSGVNGLQNAGLAQVWRGDGMGGGVLEAELTADDAAAGDRFGVSVSVSGDTTIVGAELDNHEGIQSGSAYIFTRSGTTWTLQQKLVAGDAGDGDYFGTAVSVSGDTVVVGATADDDGGSQAGAAYVFVRSGTTWTQQQKLVASDAAANDYFGCSVSVSADTIIVGAKEDDDGGSFSGSAYVFTRTGDVWSQQQKLTAGDAAGGERFGSSVSATGDIAVVGAPLDDDNGGRSGSAYIFSRSGGVWTQYQKITASDAAADAEFGCSVSISNLTAIVGARTETAGGQDSGAAYAFRYSSGTGTWTEQGKLTASDPAAGDEFGTSVAVSGNLAVVGTPFDDRGDASGAVYIFARSTGVWSQLIKVPAVAVTDTAAWDRFGYSVSISGNTALIGVKDDDEQGDDAGAAYIFTRSGGVWIQQQKLTVSDVAAGGNFGSSVSLDGDTAVVGAYLDQYYSAQSGSVYVFTRSGNLWTQQQKLRGSDTAAGDMFGVSVSVSGDTLLVGAYGDYDAGYLSGSAYIFTRSGSVWTQQQKLVATYPRPNNYFGWSVSLSGDTAFIGAYGDDVSDNNTGAAYFFKRSGDVWTALPRVVPDDVARSDSFGYSVSISGDTAVAGSHEDDDGGNSSGSAYIFTCVDSTTWTLVRKLTASDAAFSDFFGYAVSISGDRVVVGAPWDDDGADRSGSAYIFTRSGDTWTETRKLVASDAGETDFLGKAVSINGNFAICGACDKDDPETDSGAAYVYYLSAPPTPTPSLTPSPSPSLTASPTASPSSSPTQSPTPSLTTTPAITDTPKPTPPPTGTRTETPTDTPEPTLPPTETPSPTETPTETGTPTDTPKPTLPPTETPSPTETGTPTDTPKPTLPPTETPSPTETPTETGTPTDTPMPTLPPTETPSPTETGTPTDTPTPTLQVPPTPTPSASADSDRDGIGDAYEIDHGSDPADPASVPSCLDLDGNETVDTVDAVIFYEIAVGKKPMIPSIDLISLDLNGDGRTNLVDALLFYRNRIRMVPVIPIPS